MTDKTGGPAFPVRDDDARWGLSLRDYFAAKALQGICSTLQSEEHHYWRVIAADAYKAADAMLEARKAQ